MTPADGPAGTRRRTRFRRLYLEVEEYIKKTFRKGDPKDFFVGPKAARLFKEGLVLRDSALPRRHRGALQVSEPRSGVTR